MKASEKTVLVTGAAKGIGKSIVILFAQNGYNVVINYLNSEKEAQELTDFVEKNYSISAMNVKADISCEEEVEKMITKVIDKFGRIDVLVNNAALEINSEFVDKTKRSFQQVLEINVIGNFLVTKLVGLQMKKNQYGKIVFVTSNNAIDQNDPITMEYDASKAALNSMMKNFAIELGPFVNVNAVAPGWVKTEKVKKLNMELQGKLEEEESKRILLRRFGNPEEVAKVVLFLASDDASYINGEIIRVDGGVKNV